MRALWEIYDCGGNWRLPLSGGPWRLLGLQGSSAMHTRSNGQQQTTKCSNTEKSAGSCITLPTSHSCQSGKQPVAHLEGASKLVSPRGPPHLLDRMKQSSPNSSHTEGPTQIVQDAVRARLPMMVNLRGGHPRICHCGTLSETRRPSVADPRGVALPACAGRPLLQQENQRAARGFETAQQHGEIKKRLFS